mgnify:CR=1 FL=1
MICSKLFRTYSCSVFNIVISHSEHSLSDEEYFPKYLKAHIDRGAKYLYSEFKYSNGNFYKHLIELDKGI